MAAEFYLLAPGEYEFLVTLEGADDPIARQQLTVTGKRSRAAVELPPRTLCEVAVQISPKAS